MPGKSVIPGVIELDAAEVAQGLSLDVHVKSTKWYDLRMWLGLGLMRLGMAITGFHFEMSGDVDNRTVCIEQVDLPDILYAGWVRGGPEDVAWWAEMCVDAPHVKRPYYQPPDPDVEGSVGAVAQINVTPENMQRIIDEGLTDYVNAFTAYYHKTGVQLPKRRQLGGGAGVQL